MEIIKQLRKVPEKLSNLDVAYYHERQIPILLDWRCEKALRFISEVGINSNISINIYCSDLNPTVLHAAGVNRPRLIITDGKKLNTDSNPYATTLAVKNATYMFWLAKEVGIESCHLQTSLCEKDILELLKNLDCKNLITPNKIKDISKESKRY